jgi:nicotinamide-nucleotide amidase
MKRPEQLLLDFLKERGLIIAFAESMTCGLAAARMGNISGTADAFAGGIVCYGEKAKSSVMGVPARLIQTYSAESKQVTDRLAQNLKKIYPADVCAAVTGLAAPGGSESRQKPVGTVFMAVTVKGRTYGLRKKFNGSPLVIKQKACDWLFRFILQTLKKSTQP